MTEEQIAHAVQRLIALDRADNEAAAAGAEQLRVEVLQAIARGALNPQRLAQAVLRTVDRDVGGR